MMVGHEMHMVINEDGTKTSTAFALLMRRQNAIAQAGEGLGYLLKEPRYTARWYFAMFAPSWLLPQVSNEW